MKWKLFKKKEHQQATQEGNQGMKKTTELSKEAKRMLKYMEEKYGETFKPGLFQAANWAYNADSMSVLSDKFPGEFIAVEKEKNNQYKDSYLGFVYRQENERRMQEIATKLYGKCKVISRESCFVAPVGFTAQTPFETYMDFARSSVRSEIFVDYTEKNRDFEGLIETLTQMMEEEGMKQDVGILVMREEIGLEQVNRESVKKMINIICMEKCFVAYGSILYGEKSYQSSKWKSC